MRIVSSIVLASLGIGLQAAFMHQPAASRPAVERLEERPCLRSGRAVGVHAG
jgi:hypothetical protein